MIRTKMLTVLVGIIATLAVSAAPAFAEFESASSSGKGAVKVGEITIEGGGATLTCTSAEGTWKILSGGVESKKGKNEQLTLTTYTGCKTKSSFIKEAKPTVGACTLELEQAAGESKAIGAIVGTCKIEVKVLGTCTITAEGKGLKENTLSNVGENDVITANDSNITSKPSSACLGIKATTEAKEKAVATAIGQKWL